MASRFGRSAIPTVPATNSPRATATTTGSGAGVCVTPASSPATLPYTIGKSNPAKDWFFQEVPHSTTTAWLNPAAKDPYNQRFGWVAIPPTSADPWPQWGKGRATTWTVKFNMPKASKGEAVLRVALAGADGGNGSEASVPGNLAFGATG